MRRTNQDQLVFYQFDSLPESVGLAHGAFTRLGGVSTGIYDSLNVGSTVGDHPGRVMENRHRVASAMGVRDDQTVTTWQVHGAAVLVVDQLGPQEWPPPKADAIITAREGVPLVMRYADCVPILLFDPVRRVLGMAHAGWRGTVAGAGVATAQAMVDQFGCNPDDILAGIGPSIGPCCYEVGPEVVEQVHAAFGGSDGLIHLANKNGGNSRFDLWEANRRTLEQVGIRQIEMSGICSSCNTHEFYSHRAEAGQTGRFAMLAVMRNGVGS